MSIIEAICDAFRQAITEYETENAGKIPASRQKEIMALRIRLDECQNSDINALVFRHEMIEYIRRLPKGFLGFIPAFESHFRKKLQGVLIEFRFSETQLMIQHCVDVQRASQSQINAQKAQIDTLTQQVKELMAELGKERVKDNVQTVNALTQTLALEKQKVDYLTANNMILKESLNTTAEALYTLQKNHEALLKIHETSERKYDELLQEKNSSREKKLHTNNLI